MSRPKPTVLIEHINKDTYKVNQILESEAIWAVFYKDSPFNMKTSSMLSYHGPKYRKVSFSNQGHAITLCKKLNKLFRSTEFSVVMLHKGDKIYPL